MNNLFEHIKNISNNDKSKINSLFEHEKYMRIILDNIMYVSNNVSNCQDDHIISTNRVNKTFITIIIEKLAIDEYDYNTFRNETGPKMQEHIQYKTGLIVEIAIRFEIIYLQFIKYVKEFDIKYCPKVELIKSINNDLNILIQDITFYQSI